MPTRTSFHRALDELWEQMAALAQLDAVAVERASLALLDANRQRAELVISESSDIEAAGAKLEDQALQLLALQSPVARDLRLVMSIFPLASALTRMGGLARHVARLTRNRAPQAVVVDDALIAIVDAMGEKAQAMAAGLVTALANQDVAAARAVEESDHAMDELYRRLLTEAKRPTHDHAVDAAVDVALLGRFYERFADQAVDVARRMRFVVTGVRDDEG